MSHVVGELQPGEKVAVRIESVGQRPRHVGTDVALLESQLDPNRSSSHLTPKANIVEVQARYADLEKPLPSPA